MPPHLQRLLKNQLYLYVEYGYYKCDRRKAWVMPESKYSIGGIKNGISILFFTTREGAEMPNTELPIDLENQVILMKKYVNFRQRKKMREFLEYAGYFRASRYGKYLLTQVNAFGSKADSKVFFALYNFDVQIRLLLFKYCKKAEVYFKSAVANAVSLKTGDAGFYLNKQFYTPSKSEFHKSPKSLVNKGIPV